jgi:hypothetical protein
MGETKPSLKFPLFDGANAYVPKPDDKGEAQCPVCSGLLNLITGESVTFSGETGLYDKPVPLGDGFTRKALSRDDLISNLGISWLRKSSSNSKSERRTAAGFQGGPIEVNIARHVAKGQFQISFCSTACLRRFFDECVDELEMRAEAGGGDPAAKKMLEAELATVQAALRRNPDKAAVYTFMKFVDDVGYQDVRIVDTLETSRAELVSEAVKHAKQLIEDGGDDPVLLNNLGVLLLNSGCASEAGAYIRQASKLAPNDRTIHENLRILDILQRRPRTRWHDVPEDAKPGSQTLLAYFDPHGM